MLFSVVQLIFYKDHSYDIVQGLIVIGWVFRNQCSKPDILICGIVPRDDSFSINSMTINEVNDLLKSTGLVKNFHSIDIE